MADFKRIIQRTTNSERVETGVADLQPNEICIVEDGEELIYKDKNGKYISVSKDKYKVGTIEDLKKSKKYKIGDVVEVLGYYTPGDGGGHPRKKMPEGYTGADIIIGSDGSIWGITHSGEINVLWLGAKGDGIVDDTLAIQKSFLLNSEIINGNNRTYFITSVPIPKGIAHTTRQEYGMYLLEGKTIKNFNFKLDKLALFYTKVLAFYLENKHEKIIIDNVHIDGNGDIADKSFKGSQDGGLYLLYIRPHATLNTDFNLEVDFSCYNSSFTNAGTDGMTLGVGHGEESTYVLENVVFKNNRRADILFGSGKYYHINNCIVFSTNKNALDVFNNQKAPNFFVEPDSSETIKKIRISNVKHYHDDNNPNTFFLIDYANGVLIVEETEIINCQTPASFGISSMGIATPDNLQIKNILLKDSIFGLDVGFANLTQHQPVKIDLDSVIIDNCNVGYISFGNSHIKNLKINNTTYLGIANLNYSTSTKAVYNNCEVNMGAVTANERCSILANGNSITINDIIINGDRNTNQKTPIQIYGNSFVTANNITFNDSNYQGVITNSGFTGIINFTDIKFLRPIYANNVRFVLDGTPNEVIIVRCTYRGGRLHSTMTNQPNFLALKENIDLTIVDVSALNTPYHALKMEERGILGEYHTYLDELHEYEKSKNIDSEIMTLEIREKPVLSKGVEDFAKEYGVL